MQRMRRLEEYIQHIYSWRISHYLYTSSLKSRTIKKDLHFHYKFKQGEVKINLQVVINEYKNVVLEH